MENVVGTLRDYLQRYRAEKARQKKETTVTFNVGGGVTPALGQKLRKRKNKRVQAEPK